MDKRTSATPTADVQTLCDVAFLANRLAKQLTGPDRFLAYRIKSAALSSLILAGAARPNGFQADSIVGLDIFGATHSRLHVPMSHLRHDAQALIRRQSGFLPKVAPLAERLNAAELDELNSVFQHRAA